MCGHTQFSDQTMSCSVFSKVRYLQTGSVVTSPGRSCSLIRPPGVCPYSFEPAASPPESVQGICSVCPEKLSSALAVVTRLPVQRQAGCSHKSSRTGHSCAVGAPGIAPGGGGGNDLMTLNSSVDCAKTQPLNHQCENLFLMSIC